MNCKRCNHLIPEERMEALPDTVLCVKCSAKIGSDFEYLVVEENVGNSVLSKLFVHRQKREIEPL
jgi:Prokaryotic dksA/traR C4-type zinc finger